MTIAAGAVSSSATGSIPIKKYIIMEPEPVTIEQGINYLSKWASNMTQWADAMANVLTAHTAVLIILVVWTGFLTIWRLKK